MPRLQRSDQATHINAPGPQLTEIRKPADPAPPKTRRFFSPMTVLVRRFLDIARFPLEPRPPRDIFASMSPLPRHLPPLFALLPALAFAAATTLALARPAPTPPPTLQPDETASAFIERWNEWAHTTDPDQQLTKDLKAAYDAIRAEYMSVLEQYRADPFLEDLPNASNWRAIQAYAERIAPHTARIRELLASPHAARPFPGPEVEAAELKANPPEDGVLVLNQDPVPTNQLEMYLLDIGGSSSILGAMMDVQFESNYVIRTGNLGRALANINAYFDAYRLQIERGTLIDSFSAHAIESDALSAIQTLLVRHGSRLRDGALESLQDAMLAHAERRRGLAESLQLEQRVMAELLPTWFDPEQPDRLTDRGRAFLDAISLAGAEPNWLDPDFRFSLRTRPTFEGSLAPASEQVRIFNAINAAYARDTAIPWHAREDLESARLFKAIVEADPHGRLAPALDRFMMYNSNFGIDLAAEIELRAALTMIGVHRHRARTGAWPAALADIDPDVMRFDPIDPHSGQPFGYAVIDEQPTLWSTGPDRDNDDARPIPRDPAEEWPTRHTLKGWFTLNEWAALPPEVQAEYDGDIPLFPPPTRD